MKKIILVLEDCFDRIEWLRRNNPQGHRIVWATGVQSFQKLFNLVKDSLVLIILDHDLGATPIRWVRVDWGHGPSDDPFGLNGLDAARWLALQSPLPPVVVWSVNFGAADSMISALVDKTPVLRLPFIGPSIALIKAKVSNV